MSANLAVVGAGWAGLAAAVAATAAGHRVTVFEASRHLGGRARTLAAMLPNGTAAPLDNGQHILAGAYAQTCAVMRMVGVDPDALLLRMPLTLRFPGGDGLALPAWRAPLDAVAGILGARGWTFADKLSLLRTAARWRRAGFECNAGASVNDLCVGLAPRVLDELIEPLCVSALNTPMRRASGQVFLRVIRDTLFEPGGSNLLVPRCELGRLFPEPAAHWLRSRGATIETGHRVQALEPAQSGWRLDGRPYDAVLLACPAPEAARLVSASATPAAAWLDAALGLEYEAIATVYATGGPRLPLPLLALRCGPDRPAQFVFDRSQLGGPGGVLAFVVSAATGDQDTIERQVIAQARELGWSGIEPLRTVVEKRATFACTPGLRRPSARIAPGLFACADYVEGPYPATLEGAVRHALAAVAALADPVT